MRAGTITAVACLAGAVGACVTLITIELLHAPAHADNLDTTARYTSSPSATPGLDHADDLTCPSSHTKIILTNGVEDGFARAGHEPGLIRDRLTEFPMFYGIRDPKNRFVNMRDFDERGRDKHLYGHFLIPPGVTRAVFIARTQAAADDSTDTLSFQIYRSPEGRTLRNEDLLAGLGRRLSSLRVASLSSHPEIISLDLSSLTPRSRDMGPEISIFDRLSAISSPIALDYNIADDTMVDFTALVLCQKPIEARGMTFRMSDVGINGAARFQCIDRELQACDAYSGDLSCDASAALGCIRDGTSPVPQELAYHNSTTFHPGRVATTSPIVGRSLATREDATAYCRHTFGDDWRVLSFHDGTGGHLSVHTQGDVAQRLWVDIKDQPYANCWSRPDE